MRALVISSHGIAPVLGEVDPPTSVDGCVLIDVHRAGLGGWDIAGAYRLAVSYPCVVRGEGVGRAADGRRVYFGERSVAPYGALAEQTLVPEDEVWDIPDGISDETAILMGIAGTGALGPLQAAGIESGDAVLVLGATGAVGRVALRIARYLGAGTVVAAARDAAALVELERTGVADTAVALDGTDDAIRLRDSSGGGGFDVVLDLVYGDPFVAALRATRQGARVVTAGTLAGPVAAVTAGDLLFRTHTTVGTGQRSPAERHRMWLDLLVIAAAENISVPVVEYSLRQADDAWQAQSASPHGKVLVSMAQDLRTDPSQKQGENHAGDRTSTP